MGYSGVGFVSCRYSVLTGMMAGLCGTMGGLRVVGVW